ncbi:hypothetical protein PAHAL_3G331000 [Panicum hallii]|uniref:Uncharacterized protein n=1 Tax=Panicum hallii TaxID=206008 RepID=A0A2T8KKA3_9POAL|nr:hypothetical protein PAHAL_3G331000 [Panicum hallii]
MKNCRWKELLAYDLLRLILMVFVMNLFRKRRNPSQERTTSPADFIYSVLGERCTLHHQFPFISTGSFFWEQLFVCN